MLSLIPFMLQIYNIFTKQLTIRRKKSTEAFFHSSVPPAIPVQTPIINSLGQVSCLNTFAAVKIGDCTGDFQNPIVCAGRKSQAVHGIFQDGAAVLVQVTVFLDELRSHLGIGMDGRVFRITFLLYLPRRTTALDSPLLFDDRSL